MKRRRKKSIEDGESHRQHNCSLVTPKEWVRSGREKRMNRHHLSHLGCRKRSRLWVFIPFAAPFLPEGWVRQQNITISSSSAYGVRANHFISGGVCLLRCKISPFPLCNAVFFLHLPPHNNKHNLICLVWSAFGAFPSLCHCSRFPLRFHVHSNSCCEEMGVHMS